MQKAADPRPVRRPRRWLWRIMLLALAVVVILPLGLGLVFLQKHPALEASAPPTPEDVAATRQLVRNIRAAAAPAPGSDNALRVDVQTLNSAVRLGARFRPGLRGRIILAHPDVLGELSLPVPWLGGDRWLNIAGRVPEFDGAFSLSDISVGGIDLPPALALSLARIAVNLGIGDGFGDKVLAAASAMQITDDTLAFRIQLDDVGKNGVMRGLFGTMRGQEMPPATEVEHYHLLIRDAMRDGTLPQQGSFLPYITFTLNAARARGTPQTLPNAYTAAVLGLAKVCGAKEFATIVGQLVFSKTDSEPDWDTSCKDVTFNGRIDSRRHFITSAALQAASNTGFSISIGEFKELYDSISGAGGFDFTDLAANLSGIALSDRFMQSPADAWPALIDRLDTENDVIVPFDGIPQIMSEAAFKARYGDVDSQRYKTEVARITARIVQIRLHQAP